MSNSTDAERRIRERAFEIWIERPSCRCGAYMNIFTVERLLDDEKTETRVFYCDDCGHKLHVLHSMARAE